MTKKPMDTKKIKLAGMVALSAVLAGGAGYVSHNLLKDKSTAQPDFEFEKSTSEVAQNVSMEDLQTVNNDPINLDVLNELDVVLEESVKPTKAEVFVFDEKNDDYSELESSLASAEKQSFSSPVNLFEEDDFSELNNSLVTVAVEEKREKLNSDLTIEQDNEVTDKGKETIVKIQKPKVETLATVSKNKPIVKVHQPIFRNGASSINTPTEKEVQGVQKKVEKMEMPELAVVSVPINEQKVSFEVDIVSASIELVGDGEERAETSVLSLAQEDDVSEEIKNTSTSDFVLASDEPFNTDFKEGFEEVDVEANEAELTLDPSPVEVDAILEENPCEFNDSSPLESEEESDSEFPSETETSTEPESLPNQEEETEVIDLDEIGQSEFGDIDTVAEENISVEDEAENSPELIELEAPCNTNIIDGSEEMKGQAFSENDLETEETSMMIENVEESQVITSESFVSELEYNLN